MLTLGACQTASSGEEEAGLVLLTDAELAERFKSSAIVKPGHDAPMEMFFPGGHYQYLMPAMSAGRYWILNREVCVENKAVMEDVLCRKFGRNALGEIFEVSRRSGEGESVSIRDAARIEFQPF